MIPSPPIILLGIDNPIGLALIRELGAAGIEVHGIAREKRALGLHSRRLARGHMLEPKARTPSWRSFVALRAAAAHGSYDGVDARCPAGARSRRCGKAARASAAAAER
jgi:hypothetical protein